MANRKKNELINAISDELAKAQGIQPKRVKDVAETVDEMLAEEMTEFPPNTARFVDLQEDASPFRAAEAARRNRLRIKREVLMLKGIGFTDMDVSLVTGISVNLLYKDFGDEIKKGALMQTAAVLRNLHSIATDPDHRGSTQAAIFWAKARAGWTETSRTEVTGADGQPLKMEVSQAKVLDSSKLSPDHREKLREILEAAIAQQVAPVQGQEIAGDEEATYESGSYAGTPDEDDE